MAILLSLVRLDVGIAPGFVLVLIGITKDDEGCVGCCLGTLEVSASAVIPSADWAVIGLQIVCSRIGVSIRDTEVGVGGVKVDLSTPRSCVACDDESLASTEVEVDFSLV